MGNPGGGQGRIRHCQVIKVPMDTDTVPKGFGRVILKGNHENIMVETIGKPLAPGWWQWREQDAP
jgi:hypothetical protein